MSELERLARQAAEKIMEYLHPDHDEEELQAVVETITDTFASTAIGDAEGYREGVEAAAKVCDRRAAEADHNEFILAKQSRLDAEAIRALPVPDGRVCPESNSDSSQATHSATGDVNA